jgi:predicted metallopeptidase
MIAYFLLSALLLTVGMLFYSLIFKERVSAHQAKSLLMILLVFSLSAPYFVPGLPNYSKMLSEGKVFYEDYTDWNVVDINDKKLIECYNKAANSKDICDCEIIQKASKVTFTYNPLYNFFIKYGWYLIVAFYAISALVLITVIFKLLALIYLVRKSRLSLRNHLGFKFYLLYPFLNKQLPLSAFSLSKNYVIWSPILNSLKENEKEIVIAHEVSHLRNKDSWYLLFLEFLKTLLWICPAYFWFIREFRKQQEFIADESASKFAGSKRQYAGLLLSLKEWQFNSKNAYAFSSLLSGSIFKKRILRLVKQSNNGLKPLNFFLGTVSLIVLLWLSAYTVLPLIQSEELKLKQYEILAESHNG